MGKGMAMAMATVMEEPIPQETGMGMKREIRELGIGKETGWRLNACKEAECTCSDDYSTFVETGHSCTFMAAET